MKEQDQFKTGFMTAAYRPECAKSSESVPKPEKVLIIAIFAVQMLFFWCLVCRTKKIKALVNYYYLN